MSPTSSSFLVFVRISVIMYLTCLIPHFFCDNLVLPSNGPNQDHEHSFQNLKHLITGPSVMLHAPRHVHIFLYLCTCSYTSAQAPDMCACSYTCTHARTLVDMLPRHVHMFLYLCTCSYTSAQAPDMCACSYSCAHAPRHVTI